MPHKTARFLFLPGGGIWGAIQPIAIKKLLPKKYDHIYGCSIGAINGSYLSQFKPNDFSLATDSLSSMWKDIHDDISSSQYHTLSAYNFIRIYKSSLHSDSIIKEIVHKYLPSINSHKKNNPVFHCPVTNMETGCVEIYNNNKNDSARFLPDIKPFIIASASLPIILPFSKINNKIYADGGILKYLSKFYIEELAQDYHEIEIDVVHNRPKDFAIHIDKNEYDVNIGLNGLNLIKVLTHNIQNTDEKDLVDQLIKCGKKVTITNTYIKNTPQFREIQATKTYQFDSDLVDRIQNLEIEIEKRVLNK